MNQIEIYAVICCFPELVENKTLSSRYNQMIDEILEMSDATMSIHKLLATDLVNDIIDKEHDELFVNTILKFTNVNEHKSPSFIGAVAPELINKIYISQMENLNLNILYCRVNDLITAANICIPGLLAMKKYFIYKNGKYYSSIDISLNTVLTNHSFFPERLLNKKISLRETIKWLNAIEKNNNCSTTPLGRAVGAIKHILFLNLLEPNAILWALIAIEALYCRETDVTKTKQIIDKSAIIAPSIEKKRAKKNVRYSLEVCTW